MVNFDDLDVNLSEVKTKEELKQEEIQKNAHIVNGGEASFACPSCGGKGYVVIGYVNIRHANCFKCKATGKVSKGQLAAVKAKKTREENLVKKKAEFIMSNPDVYEFICHNKDWSNFYASMHDSIMTYGHLTEKQLESVRNGMEKAKIRAAEKQAQREANTAEVNVSKIEQLFDVARSNGLKRLGFRTENINISAAKENSANPGALYVKHDDVYVGKIMNGKFMPTNAAKSDTLEKVLEVAANPKEKAVQYGKMTGRCSCCGKELTDDVSVAMGIGPICESKWGF